MPKLRPIPAFAVFAFVSACTVSEKTPSTVDTSAASPPAGTVDAAAGATPDVATPARADTANPADTSTTSGSNWIVTVAGIGRVTAGMTIAQANAVLGDNKLIVPAKLQECDYVRPKSGPDGVNFMVEKGTISRVDVRDNRDVRTAAGARIGDSEERIRTLYPLQVMVQPHKYTDGHYLVITPRAATGRDMRIVFETDGKTVTRFRSGRLPAVEYVEGCS